MDFHSLTRRDLQFLCKKNGVPANLTNIAMAKALESLETVEGIEEIQEALGFRSPKLNSPEIRRTGLSTSSRRVTDGDEPKIQQKQEPSPLHRSHRVTVKTLEVTEMASKEDETQETLDFQSLNVNSTELPRMGRRTSVRRAALEEEPKIQQLKPSSLHRSRRAASKDLEAIDMASKMEEGEKKEVSQILPKTPAARKAAKGVEAQSLRRTKKNEEVESHTESPKAVEAKGGKAIGVVTRRSTRLSSKKPLEETVTTQSNSRSSSRENSAIKMEALAKEDTRRSTRLSSRKPLEESVTTQSNKRSSSRENSAVKMEALAKLDIAEQEMQEEKKDLVEYGDSCVVIVEEHEEKVPEKECHEFSSSIDVDYSNCKVKNKCKAIHEDVPMNKQQQSSPRPLSRRATPKALEATKMVYKEDDDKKLPKLLPNTRRSTRLSSRKPVEDKSREEEATDKMAVLSEEDAEEQEKEEEKKDIDEKNHSFVVAPVVEDEEKVKNEESHGHGYSSFIEVKNGDSIVVLVEEVKENDQEVESHGFSSFTQGEGSNIEVENGDSTVERVKGDEEKVKKESHGNSSFIKVKNGDSIVAIVEEVKESDQEVESHGFSSSTQGEEGSYIEFENGDSTVEHVKGVEKNGQELENQAFSSSIEWENPNVEQMNVSNVVLVEEEGKKDQEESHDLSASLEENSKAEVDEPFESTEEFIDQTPVNEYMKDSSDQSPENENVEVYGDQSPENKAVEYCGDQSPENDLVEDSSNQGSKFVEVSGDPLLTNEAAEDSGDYSSDAKLAGSALSGNLLCSEVPPLPHEEAIVCIQQSSGIEEEADKLSLLFTEMTMKETEECNSLLEPVLPVAMVLPQHADLFSVNVDAITNLGHETTTEAIRETPEEASEINTAIEELFNDDLSDAGELTANDSVEVQSTSIEPQILVSSTIEFSEEAKESSGDLPSELTAEIKESFEDNLADSSELAAVNDIVDVPQKAETLQRSFFELKIHVSSSELCSTVDYPSKIPEDSVEEYLRKLAADESFDVHSPVSCGGELCSELTTADSAIEFEAFGLRGEISAVAGLSSSDELSSEKSINAENSQDATFEPQNPVHSTAESCVEFSANPIYSPLKLPCESEPMSLVESSIVQTQPSDETGIIAATEIAEEKEEAKTKALEKPSEEAGMDATEIAEEKEEAKTKALEKKDVLLKDGGNLELLSLTKLRAMYKQMLNGTKTEEKKNSITEQEDFKRLSCIKYDENCKQKLNDDTINLERKKSIIRQEDSNCKQSMSTIERKKSLIKPKDLECLSHSKFDSNRKQKLNDDTEIKSERKRTPLKNLNYSSF